jgi:negative regulator of flagellin synthesis FlgM
MTVKINGNNPLGPMGQVKKSPARKTVKDTNKHQPSDRVEFSNVFKDITSAKGVANTTAMDRTEKVESIKEQVASGTYKPDLLKVAASLLRFLFRGRMS